MKKKVKNFFKTIGAYYIVTKMLQMITLTVCLLFSKIIGCQKSLAVFVIEFSIVHKIGYDNAI